MSAHYSFDRNCFSIHNYHEARPFSSFLPGIAGEYGKPMWVFYTNRGQCISSFGVRNKNSAMLEFYPANKAYTLTSRLGFRTFLKIGSGTKRWVYEPFQAATKGVEQVMRIRAHEVEIEETNRALGLRIRAILFAVPNEEVPVLLRQVEIENLGKKAISFEMVDGLPQVVPYGLSEPLLKQMSRTMEAFTEVVHGSNDLPFFKLKIEPSDRPEIEWIEAGFFNFSFIEGKTQKILTDPDAVFGSDTSFETPLLFQEGKSRSWRPRLTSLTPCAFSVSAVTLPGRSVRTLQSYFGQASTWDAASSFRRRVQKDPFYAVGKRQVSAELLSTLTDAFAIHSAVSVLDPYSRQAFLDNALRGGLPYVENRDGGMPQVFHYYSRKHGDMERDYNFFEVSPTYFSQGNGNFRDVNQNRRSEVLLHPDLGAANIETFFNLLQLDGYNPLVIQFEKFFLRPDDSHAVAYLMPEKRQEEWRAFLEKPFNPGELFERLLKASGSHSKARQEMSMVLARAQKIQDASHGEGFWVDHWTYNLDLIENFSAVYPDQLKALFVERKDFTYYDSDHIVQPRHKKFVLRVDGHVRQMNAVIRDKEKADRIRQRTEDPQKVRTLQGQGPIFKTTLLAKTIGLLAVKAATLDPFGIGIEMEAEKPGWCDALNGMPGILGSSVNESFELRRWLSFIREHLPSILPPGGAHPFAEEIADLIRTTREALALSKSDDFYKTWDTLSSLRERFRERTRLGVSGQEISLTREEIESFLDAAAKVLDAGLPKAFQRSGICVTYFINDVVEHELLPATTSHEKEDKPIQNVKALRFKQKPLSDFLEGPVHALRVMGDAGQARKLYRAVKGSGLFDQKLKMYRLNVPLEKESFEIGRAKIFTPGWLENESVFLHMAYKFLLETLRSGLVKEFFDDFKTGLVAFQKPLVYGRSPYENSSFIVSSRFPDARVHGAGFVARLTGATAEWISMVLFMGLGRQPFRWENNQLTFRPTPTLPAWFFTKKAVGAFASDSFGFKLFGKTWIVYRNPLRKDTFGQRPLVANRYALRYDDGHEIIHAGDSLPDALARDLRKGKLAKLLIELGSSPNA